MRWIRWAGIAVGTYAIGVLVWHLGGRTGHGHPWSQSWLGGLVLAAAVGLWTLAERLWRRWRGARRGASESSDTATASQRGRS